MIDSGANNRFLPALLTRSNRSRTLLSDAALDSDGIPLDGIPYLPLVISTDLSAAADMDDEDLGLFFTPSQDRRTDRRAIPLATSLAMAMRMMKIWT